MRIEASNLIAAQAARAPQRAEAPPQKKPSETAKPSFESIDFPKAAKDVSEEKPAHPPEGHKPSGPKHSGHKHPGSHVDIKV